MAERPLRFCDVCGGMDDHPRHVITGVENRPTSEFLDALPPGAPVAAVALLVDPTLSCRHMDCCAAAGCPICAATEVANGGVRGAELIKKVTGAAEPVDVDGIDFDPVALIAGGATGG